MKTIFTIILCTNFYFAQGQTAETIVSTYLENIGGEETGNSIEIDESIFKMYEE